MGLNFSHGKAAWCYHGFNLFRAHLARDIGIDLWSMDGFGGYQEWPSATDDPIIDLLNHSDCDGDLSPKQCAVIAPRLRELVSKWPDGDWEVEQDRALAILLAEGMEDATAKKQHFKFC